MNKSPQYNKQSKSEVEEICIYQDMESVTASISENKYCCLCSMPERIP